MGLFRRRINAAVDEAVEAAETNGRSAERAAIVHYLIETADWCDRQRIEARSDQANTLRWLACRIALCAHIGPSPTTPKGEA